MLKRILEQALLVVAGLTVALVVLEALARLGTWPFAGYHFGADESRSAMLAQVSNTQSRLGDNRAGEYLGRVLEVIHPYLGYVPDPSAFSDRTTIGDPGQILAPSDDSLIVGFFGGSFANGVCHSAGDELRRVLARPGEQVRLLCLTAGGYKQPQQFLALAYLLAQGGHLDLVINLIADRNRRDWADRFARWRADRSALLSSVWENLDRRLAARRDTLVAEIQNHKVEQRKGYVLTGPKMTFADQQSFDAYLTRVWRDSSMQMKLLCEANHVAYVHFLQPNQYVVGSKPLAPEEARLTTDRGLYRKAGEHGYPILRKQGEDLRRAGVRFHDLSMVFENVREPLYNDGCCHLNPVGYAMIARAIGDTLRADADGAISDAARR